MTNVVIMFIFILYLLCSTWQETSENIVSSKTEIDNEKFTVSVSPVKASNASDCIAHNVKQEKLRRCVNAKFKMQFNTYMY